jgi:hypothetical protein
VKGGFFLRKKPVRIVLPEYSYWKTAVAQQKAQLAAGLFGL